MADSKIFDLTGLATLAATDVIHVVDVSDTTDSDDGTSKKYAVGIASGFVGVDDTQTLTAKTLTSPTITTPTVTGGAFTSAVLTTPQINDTSADHQYVFAVSELAADRTVTLPLLTAADTFVFAAFTQTLTNKTLTTPIIASLYQDAGKTLTVTMPAATTTLVGRATTDTLTNKRVTKRVTTITSNANPTVNTDSCDVVDITAQAAAIASMTTNLSGTPTNFQTLIVRIKDDGTARAITWGASFEARGVALPTTTVLSKVLTVGFIYDTATSKWGCVASAQET